MKADQHKDKDHKKDGPEPTPVRDAMGKLWKGAQSWKVGISVTVSLLVIALVCWWMYKRSNERDAEATYEVGLRIVSRFDPPPEGQNPDLINATRLKQFAVQSRLYKGMAAERLSQSAVADLQWGFAFKGFSSREPYNTTLFAADPNAPDKYVPFTPETLADAFQKASQSYDALAKNSGKSRELVLAALMAQANCEEWRGQVARAKYYYEQVVSRFGDMKDHPHVIRAKQSLEVLNQPEMAALYGNWPALLTSKPTPPKFEPPPPPTLPESLPTPSPAPGS